jgi:hypothetical protein
MSRAALETELRQLRDEFCYIYYQDSAELQTYDLSVLRAREAALVEIRQRAEAIKRLLKDLDS